MEKKTIKDVDKLLKPLYRMGKPFIISEKDYKWVREVLGVNGYRIVRYMSEDVYFDTLYTKIKPVKLTCLKCFKSTGKVKFFSTTNDMLTLKPYHEACYRKIK